MIVSGIPMDLHTAYGNYFKILGKKRIARPAINR